ncbi:hypothetical protein [Spirulina major]|uniref:hypothetical protein n=1 Tax=Spirulina major TaxID=270636 RepID=UPI0009351E00|nr:hypothetical protein [Spirulina major]
MPLPSDRDLTDQWRDKIRRANRNNIFCHCRTCGEEWVASDGDGPCICGSRDLEAIACWQFPDG